jgi:hypothetical protein
MADICRLCEQQPVGIDEVCPDCWVQLARSVDTITRYEPNRVVDLNESDKQMSEHPRR